MTRLKFVLLPAVLFLTVALGLYAYRKTHADLLSESVRSASSILRISVVTERGVDRATNLEILKAHEKTPPVGAPVPFLQSTPSSSAPPASSEWIVFYEAIPFQASGRERIQTFSRLSDGSFRLSNSFTSRMVSLEELREKIRQLGGSALVSP